MRCIKKWPGLAKSLPDNVQYAMPYDTTKFIKRSIEEVRTTLLQAIGLVILVVFSVLTELARHTHPGTCHSGITDWYFCRDENAGLLDQHHYAVRAGAGDRSRGR